MKKLLFLLLLSSPLMAQILPAANGGTGANNTATSGRYLKGNGTAFVTSSGSVSGTGACSASNWVSTLNSDAAPTCTQPAFTNITGVATTSQIGTGTPSASTYVDGATGAWTALPAGTGTVTTFSAGTLSPLFTTSVATATTTPALSFSLTNAAGGTLFGNNTTSSASPAYTIAPVLGIPGTSTGTLALASSTASGKFTLTAPASSSTPTITLPTSTGTLADSATSPLVLNSTTGILTCPTCVTTVGHGLSFTIGDPSSVALTAASTTTDYVTVPFACTISAYNLLVDAGTITVKFWKIATGTAIPTSANSINTSGVSISSGTAIHSTTLSDFTTTTVTANDIIAMTVTAVATAKYVNGVLECDQ